MTSAEPTAGPRRAIDSFASAFDKVGYGVIKNACPANVAAHLGAKLSSLFEREVGGAEGRREFIIPRIVEREPEFAALATAPGLLEVMTRLFGCATQLACSYGHMKPPKSAAHTAPHSDVAHLPGVPHEHSLVMIKAMYALTPVPREAGPTAVYPGTHRSAAATGTATPVALEPGDLLLFHANLRHSSTANVSSTARLSAWFAYSLPWMRIFPGFEFSAEFLAAQQEAMEHDARLRTLYGLSDPYAT